MNLIIGISSTVTNFLSLSLGLVGFGYSAIASHRQQWGVVLVLAWISSLLAATTNMYIFAWLLLPVP
jgi:hypothetical protein